MDEAAAWSVRTANVRQLVPALQQLSPSTLPLRQAAEAFAAQFPTKGCVH
eukprot:CAMPEP_0202054934 /NCGR_PEP_ID=MMETSP0963-20130614/10761_1 /ASSEMBLY_ACC=CAM_ASM_000494 /TAXON_ID=4773 /ORGANISM="Schizochytrium aggregatum, Strain ATCC28209" /LENGTH=49 /DNA_ID=CAMNT_0048620423 /DNA_START=332 /DNA_END=481 /DNA_ORIENTATION=+